MAALRALVTRGHAMLSSCRTTRPTAVLSTAGAKMSSDDSGVKVKPFEEIPGPRGLYNLPYIGAMFHYKPFTDVTHGKSMQVFSKMLDTYGPIVKVQLRKLSVIISEPSDLETVFRNEGKYPMRPPNELGVLYAKRNNLKDSLSQTQGEEWHALRSPLNKRLVKVDSATHYLEPQNTVADELVDILSHHKLEPNDLQDLFFRYTAESIGVVCFNARLGFMDIKSQDPESKTFLEASRRMFRPLQVALTGGSVAHRWYKNSTYKEYENCRRIVKKNAGKHLHEAKKVMERRKKEGSLCEEEPNLLNSLLSDADIDTADITRMIESMYLAGTSSTAKNMQTFLYNLAKYPDKQEKLREEVFRVLGPEGPLTKQSLTELQYLKACLKETFRLYYPTPSGGMRILPNDVVLSGYRVPAGVPVIMHNPKLCCKYFVDADKFIPERWLRTSDGRREEDIPKTAVLPFGYGPRGCIGRRFAEQEIYLGVAKILQKLRISVEPESQNTTFIHALFVEPEQPIRFTFTQI